ncbi:MAG: hypothetical protein KDE55_20360 [Novosphingobium sp.]|nr:hypothetical protein [Novosphingobium sp.]
MTIRAATGALFWISGASILYLALAPGSLSFSLGNDTVDHTLAFIVLPLLAALAWPMVNHLTLWLALAVFGGSLELLQGGMAFGRDAAWTDWAVDLAAAAAMLVALRIMRRSRKPDVTAP